MTSRDKLLLVVVTAILSIIPLGCGEDNPTSPSSPGNGSLFITVENSSGQVLANATVLTNPATQQAQTDALGTVHLQDIAPGTYVISATHPSVGSGNTAVTVEAGKVAVVTVKLISGIFLQPMVSILSPFSGAQFAVAEPVLLRAVVGDNADSPESLELIWSSSIDGELSTDPANASGISELTLTTLSLGDHLISLSVTDSDDFVSTATVSMTVKSFSPTVAIFTPTPNQGFVPGETIHFSAMATDKETPSEQLDVVWSSDLDGVLNSTSPDTLGQLDFSVTTLTSGVHQITLTVTDGDQNESEATVTLRNNLPQRVTLDPLTVDKAGIHLSWTPVNEPDFLSYRIYRSTSENGFYDLIQILNDPQAGSYVDGDLEFGVTYWYWVGVRTMSGDESESNRQSEQAGVSINVATQVEAMRLDPQRPYLYALDRVNNSMLFVNLNSNTVEKTIFVGSSPVDMDINDSGTELFIANFGSNQIAVVDLDVQEVDRNLTVVGSGVWDGNPYRIACLGDSLLVYTSEDQWNDLELARQSDGGSVHSTGSIYAPDLEASPDDAHVFVGESGISSSGIFRYDVVGNQLTMADNSTVGGYTSRIITLSGNGTYVFYARQKFLASNLSSNLGSFNEIIYLSNMDGSIAVGRDNIHNGNTFSIIRSMPVQTTVMTLSSDDQTLYLYDTSSSRIFLFDLGAL